MNENGQINSQQQLADLKLKELELREQGLSVQQIADKLEINKTKEKLQKMKINSFLS